jgi:hypothetical protein
MAESVPMFDVRQRPSSLLPKICFNLPPLDVIWYQRIQFDLGRPEKNGAGGAPDTDTGLDEKSRYIP